MLAALAGAGAGAIELTDCRLAAADGRVEAAARCGRLPVPLDPDDPAGDTIALSVAVVPALGGESRAAPLAVLAGGPGQAASELYTLAQRAFEPVLARRGILLVDQRGTGGSAPLTCANIDAWDLHESLAAAADDVVDATLQCLAELESDPRWFTTSAAVRDLERVREALGYEKLNLYAMSYGTRVAQHYLRRYPERTRSLILDGVVPTALALGPDIAPTSQAALDALFARCAKDAACAAAFGDLPARLAAILARLDAEPAAVTLAHPLTGEAVAMTLSRSAAVGAIRLLLYSPASASLLPALIDQAFAERYQPLAAELLNIAAGMATLAYGLNFAVLCTEDVPFWGELDLAALGRTYLGVQGIDAQRRICARWPRGYLDGDLKAPLASDAPALFLTGEFDPITPERYTRLAAAGFSRAVRVFGRGQGHGLLGSGCVPRLIAEFIDHAEDAAWELNAACAERLAPAPLFVSPLGPMP